MTRRLNVSAILLIAFFFIFIVFSYTDVMAQSEPNRNAQWYQAYYGSDSLGGTFLRGEFGPDVGIGEQGFVYQYSNPLTGQYVSYQSSGIGYGVGGPLVGYGGQFSPVAEASYGPFAYGNIPTVSPTPGVNTRGFISGDLWGRNTSYYEAQYDPFASFLLGALGGYGGGFGAGLPGAYGGILGTGRVGLSTGLFGPVDDDLYEGAFRSSRGNLYGGVNLFLFEDFEEFDD